MALAFNIDKALSLLGGEQDLLKELLESFVRDKIFEPKKLEQLETLDDKSEAVAYVHYFKGAARQLSAETLAQTGQELEDILRNKKTGSLEEINKKSYLDYQNAYKAFTHALEIL